MKMKFADRQSLLASRTAGLLACAAALACAAWLSSPAALAAGRVQSDAIRGDKAELATQPSTTAHFGCETRAYDGARVFCYGPGAIRTAYGADTLLAQGFDGTGQTIVIIDAYGSPTLEADLAAFDTVFGLPPPPSIKQIHMPGSTPFDYNDPNQLGWADETSLDVQWSHAIAPGANIIVVLAVTNNDSDILNAQNYAIQHRLGAIMSESFGESEYLLLNSGAEGLQILANNEESYREARERGMSVFVSAGDSGAADPFAGMPGFPVVASASYPASSPNVTSVGGTNLFFGSLAAANPNGPYQTEVVWNDGRGAGGGGISATFAVPSYQTGSLPAATLGVLGGHRGYPDVAYNAGVVGGVIAHLGFLGAASGFYIFGGTSAGAPQWSGLTAIMNQMAGHPLGFMNNRLYNVAGAGGRDVTAGDNGFSGVSGFIAAPAWDLSTGWGTPNTQLLRALSSSGGGGGD
jgi:subtilase family serine protease